MCTLHGYVGPCHHGMVRTQDIDGGDGFQVRSVAASRGQPKIGGRPACGLGVGLTTHQRKTPAC
jgi:hypothetical protein